MEEAFGVEALIKGKPVRLFTPAVFFPGYDYISSH